MSEEIAKRDSWKIENMPDDVVSIYYARGFTLEEFEKIKRGFIPKSMEDKWFIFFESGVLYFHRSWTGRCIYSVDFIIENDKVKIKKIYVNNDKTQYQKGNDRSFNLREIEFLFSNVLLRKRLNSFIPLSKEDITTMFKCGMFGDVLEECIKKGNKSYENYREDKDVLKRKFNSETEEIVVLFALKDTFEGCVNKELNKFTNLINKWIENNTASKEVLFRYMLVGLYERIDGMRRLKEVPFDDVYKLCCKSEKNARKFKLFEKYYGKKLESFEEYYNLFTKKDIGVIKGEGLFKFVISGQKDF
jgi:hypothetical protein